MSNFVGVMKTGMSAREKDRDAGLMRLSKTVILDLKQNIKMNT